MLAADLTALAWIVAGLIALAVLFFWLALAPARPSRQVDTRLGEYVAGADPVEDSEMARPLSSRTLMPLLRGLLRFAGGLLPARNLEKINQQLIYAGNPGGMTSLDFVGLRLLLALAAGGGYYLRMAGEAGNMELLRNAAIAGLVGSFLPRIWLRRRVRNRQNDIRSALPDALDMLSIAVEAGLAFESAMLRVGEQWRNALTVEFRRAVAEMRIGAGRNEALQRMGERTGVEELNTFIAILVQSNQLGVSIAQVLSSQAEQMRILRRQRAEELARQAGVKITVVLVFFIFPVLFIVVLGPAMPRIFDFFDTVGSGM